MPLPVYFGGTGHVESDEKKTATAHDTSWRGERNVTI